MWKYCVLSKWTFLSIKWYFNSKLFNYFIQIFCKLIWKKILLSWRCIIFINLLSYRHLAHFICPYSFIDNIRKISLLKVLNWDFLLKILKYWMHKRRCTYTCIRCTICNTYKEKNLYHELFCLNYIANTVS